MTHVALIVLAAGGCAPGDAGAAGGDAGPVDDGDLAFQVRDDGDLCADDDDGGGPVESECCVREAQRPLPARARSVVDLSDVGAISIGTCGTFLFDEPPYRRGFPLPSDADAYPLKVVLPAVSGADPACAETCNEFEPHTAFGIALEADDELIGFASRRGLSILVPPPWKFVSGGCGEACPYACLGGYQEFGIRSCTTLFFGDFGFATADPAAPSVEVVIELVDLPAEAGALGDSSCCLYR